MACCCVTFINVTSFDYGQGNDGDEEESSVQNDGVVIFYDLMAVVSYVEAPMVPGHLVAHILPSSSQYTRRQVSCIMLFLLSLDKLNLFN